jgi:PKD repeat protein
MFVQVADTSTDPDGTIVSRLWDLGNGRTSTRQKLTYRYASPGTYTVTLTVTDNDGESSSTSQQVTVGGQ